MQIVSIRRGGLRAVLVGAASLLLVAPFSQSAEATTPAPVADQTAGISADPAGVLHVFYQADGTHHVINKVIGSGFQDLGGTVTSGAAGLNLFDANGTNFVFARGTNGAVYYRQENPAGNGWFDWKSLGGSIIGSPTATSMTGPDAVPIVYARGTNNALYRFVLAAGGRWQSLGGTLASEPAAAPVISASTPGIEDVFMLGANGAIYEYINSKFSKINATTDVAPAVVRFADGRTWLFGRDVSDGSLWLMTRDSDADAWANPRDLGGTLASAPSATMLNGQVNVVVGSPNGQLYRGRFVSGSLVWTALP